MPDKVQTPDTTVDFALGQTDDVPKESEIEDVQVQLMQRVKIPSIGFNETLVLPSPTKTTKSGKSNSVLDRYQNQPNNRPVQGKWKSSFTNTGIRLPFGCPSVETPDFSCDYDIVVSL